MKQDARAIRHKTLERGVAEAYDIERGAEPRQNDSRRSWSRCIIRFSRSISAAACSNPTCFSTGCATTNRRGKGPMIVCIDVSSSMQGEKELWAKAVGLTLMDIARRQRRLFRAVMFSSGDTSLKVLDLNRERRYQPELAKVIEMAEYFPGGGTDFQQPLDAAVALLEERKLKRGDIVIITDGESQVANEWLAHLKRAQGSAAIFDLWRCWLTSDRRRCRHCGNSPTGSRRSRN